MVLEVRSIGPHNTSTYEVRLPITVREDGTWEVGTATIDRLRDGCCESIDLGCAYVTEP